MMEKSLILKQILGTLCLLNSYSKFTRPFSYYGLLFAFCRDIIRYIKKGNEKEEYILDVFREGAVGVST